MKRRTICDIVFHSRLGIDSEFIRLARMIQAVQVIDKNDMHVDRAAKSGIILPCVFSLCIPFRVINMFYLCGCALIRRVADTPGSTYWEIGTESYQRIENLLIGLNVPDDDGLAICESWHHSRFAQCGSSIRATV